MFTKLLTISVLFAYCFSSPVNKGSVSVGQNVTKREANIGDHFPDWVPFKNKHGDELGEFVQVQKKNKVKKRLAPPVNFVMTALVEEGDDYYDKGGGESDNEDYFEKKDWSDLNRPASEAEKVKIAVNHTDISDIDGVVDIITKGPPQPIAAALESVNKEIVERKRQRQRALQGDVETDDEASTTTTEEPNKAEKPKKASGEEEEDDENDDEGTTEKPKLSSAEIKENEARKAKILSEVDDLKERHAQEQRHLTDRLKEDDSYKDEYPDSKSSESSSEERAESKRRKFKSKNPTRLDYDEYEDLNSSSENKYRNNGKKSGDSSETHGRKKPTRLPKTSKRVKPGKLSVFKNPGLYEIHDDDDETTTPPYPVATRGSHKFSARYTTTPASIDEESTTDFTEKPTPIVPKKRKNKRKRIRSTTPSEVDSSVAETVTDNYKQTTAFDVTAADTVQRDTTAPESSDLVGTEATGYVDLASTNTQVTADAVPASSDHKKEEHKNYSHKKGGGREHHSEHSEEHEEHGKKAYEGHHEDSRTAKGHHDKENHLGKYDDKGGVNKKHEVESGHYGDHHHEEHGKKHAKYEESGKHSKGHSTKGSHDIHKKEEYEKKVEFFEEDGDSGEEEKHGGYNHEKEHAEGGHFKTGRLKANHEHHAKGESGHFAKGGHAHTNKGHKQAAGHDSHGKHNQKHFHKEGKEGGRKWIFHHGHPAKTANLVVIDRRGDQYYHGPHYYG